MFAHLRILLFGLLVLGAGAPLRASSHTNIQTLFLILMENVSWPDLVVGTNAPYLKNVLIPQSSYCSNMFIVPGTFGSLPQYLWLESGTNWGVATDSSDPAAHHFATTNHFVIQLQNAGISWKAYQEGINGTTCPTATSGLYAAFHNPFVYFDDIYLSVTNCTNRIRPYAELERDLTNNAVARYNFITPNLCHDMHGGSGCPPGVNRILLGDQWLATEIPKITNSAAYRNHGAIIITWDEGTANVAGPFGTIVLSSEARGGGFHLTNRLDHTATFRTLQEIFGVPFLFAARNATGLGDLFLPSIQLTPPLATNGHWQVTAMGVAPGRTNVLQFAADFEATHSATGWANLLTNVPVTNRVTFLDPAGAPAPRRYYRVIEPR
jgi:hypothetical protein